MNHGWRVFVWAAAAAVIRGVLTQRLVDGTSSVSLPLVIGLTLVVAVAIEVGWRALAGRDRRRRSSGWQPGPARPPKASAPSRKSTAAPSTPTRKTAARGKAAASGVPTDDWTALALLCGALNAPRLNWLHTNSFVTPWLHSNASPALELAPQAAALRERPFPAPVGDALADFCAAVAAFEEPYLAETFPDPLLLGTDWRFFDWDHPEAFKSDTAGRELWQGRADRMQELAAAVADAYEALVETASAQPEYKKLVAARV